MNNHLILAKRMLDDCRSCEIHSLVDLGFCLAADGMYSMKGAPLAMRIPVKVIGCAAEGGTLPESVFSNLYETVYETLDAIPVQLRQDALYLGWIPAWGDMQESYGLVLSFLELFRTIYFIAPLPETENGERWHRIRQLENLQADYVAASKSGVLLRVEKKPEAQFVRLYVVAHTETVFPDDACYVPLWVGRKEGNVKGYADDKKEPSIAYLNHRINECTGLYSIWKHDSSDIVGLVHYRRMFLGEKETDGKRALISREEILRLMTRYDIMVYQMEVYSIPLNEQLISSGITQENAGRAMEVFRRLIAERQPDYSEAFDRVMSGCSFYPCNMLITRKQILDTYCTWLFSFLIDAAEELNFDTFDDANRRTAGFLAERMLTVWLFRQGLRIRELEVTRL